MDAQSREIVRLYLHKVKHILERSSHLGFDLFVDCVNKTIRVSHLWWTFSIDSIKNVDQNTWDWSLLLFLIYPRVGLIDPRGGGGDFNRTWWEIASSNNNILRLAHHCDDVGWFCVIVLFCWRVFWFPVVVVVVVAAQDLRRERSVQGNHGNCYDISGQCQMPLRSRRDLSVL